MANEIVLKRKEGKWITFTVTKSGVAVNLAATTCSFVVKEKYSDAAYVLQKVNGDFDKALAASGIIKVNISKTNSDITEQDYISELRIIFTAGTNEDLSRTITFTIEKAVHN